jgi:hypothetical protein
MKKIFFLQVVQKGPARLPKEAFFQVGQADRIQGARNPEG